MTDIELLIVATRVAEQMKYPVGVSVLPLIAALKEATMKEREACAKVCDEEEAKDFGGNYIAASCAAEIRSQK